VEPLIGAPKMKRVAGILGLLFKPLLLGLRVLRDPAHRERLLNKSKLPILKIC